MSAAQQGLDTVIGGGSAISADDALAQAKMAEEMAKFGGAAGTDIGIFLFDIYRALHICS